VIRGAGLLLLLALATFGEGGSSAPSLLAQHALLVLLGLGVLAAGGLTPAALPRSVVVPFAAFGVLAVAGALSAPYAYAAWLVVVEIAAFACVAWLAASIGPALLPRLAFGMAAVALVQSILAVAQRASGTLRPSAGFLNPNYLAAWLVAVLFVIGGAVVSRGRPAKWLAGVVAAVILAALVVIGSRAVLLGLAAGAAVLVATGTVRRATVLVLAAIVLVAGIGVGLRFRVADPFGLSRVAIWKASLGAVADDPLFGSKPGQFETEAVNLNFPLAGRPLRFERGFSTPHSDLLRAPCEFGIPATLALAIAAIAAIGLLGRKRSPVELGAVAALASFVAQGAVNDLTECPGIYLLAAALLGAVLREPSKGVRQPLSRGVSLAAAVVLIVTFAVGEVGPYRAWSIQRRLPRGGLSAGERADLDRATAANPWHPDLKLRRVADLLARSDAWSAADYAAARDAAEAAIRLHPRSASAWSALAHVEGAGCLSLFKDVASRERAEHAFAQASEAARHDPFIPLDAARFLLSAGDPEGARRHAERALAIEPSAIPPRIMLARALEAAGGAPAAEKLRSEARALAQRFATEPKESPYALALLSLDAPAGGD
jgi:tetratricopeptide (TPR) repeat protein/O-antigen ligase